MSTLILLYLFCAIVFFYVRKFYKNSFCYWHVRGVHTPPPYFPFGNMFKVFTRKQSLADKIFEIYKEMKGLGCEYCGVYFFYKKVFVPLSPELVKNILCKDFQYFHDRGINYDEINDPISAHLFSISGNKWKNLRGKLAPAFTGGKIKYMFNNIYNCADQMIVKLNEETQLNSTVELKEILARFTTDVIGSCAYGLDCNSMKHPNSEFRTMGKRAFTQTPSDTFKMIVLRTFPELGKKLRLGVFPKNVSKFFKNVIEETVNYREKYNVSRNDFLQILIHLKNEKLNDETSAMKTSSFPQNLTMNEIAAQAFIFFIAGFETTSTTMCFALFEMALNLEIQEKVRREILNVTKRFNAEITYEMLSEMIYLEKVLLESLRKYPPAPIYLRKCTKDYHIPNTDVIIEKGLSVLIPTIALHRDPEYFPNPELFDPERFDEQRRHNIKENIYIPFGYGPRICVGSKFALVQSKLALALIVKNFKFTLNTRTKLPLTMDTKGIVLNPVDGIWLNMNKISKYTLD